MDRRSTRVFVEISLSVALATVLAMITLPRLPQGGSIALNMLPLLVIALRRGVGPGIIAGSLYGVVDFMMGPYVVHWIQPLLDYPIAYGLVGLAGLLARPVHAAVRGEQRTSFALWLAAGIALGSLGRYGAHFVSGVVFFGMYAPEGQPVWLYSAVYNTYVLASGVAAYFAAVILLPILHRAAPVPDPRR